MCGRFRYKPNAAIAAVGYDRFRYAAASRWAAHWPVSWHSIVSAASPAAAASVPAVRRRRRPCPAADRRSGPTARGRVVPGRRQSRRPVDNDDFQLRLHWHGRQKSVSCCQLRRKLVNYDRVSWFGANCFWPTCFRLFPSALWHCWLGDRKDIRPGKSWVLVCWWWLTGALHDL